MKSTVIILSILVSYVVYYCLTKPLEVRLALPISSIVTMDEYYQGFPNGDYIHCVRAEVTDSEFSKFTDKMNLRKGDGLVERIPACETLWWDPDLFTETIFGSLNNAKESSHFAVYRNGRVYFVSHSS